MPAYPRRRIVAEGEVGVYHCVARCVRRAFLCGYDAASGRNFDHRKQWLRQRLETIAGIFAVDVLGFAVMSNHLHLVLRTRPDIAANWSNEEVARRWRRLFPRRQAAEDHTEDQLSASGAGRNPRAPKSQTRESETRELEVRGLETRDLAMLLADVAGLAERRRRLASLSWLMRTLCEPAARIANREDHCTGRFWEGRFKSQALLDEAALLACSIYVDLNPIRAGIAETPETSAFTAACERIASRQARRAEATATSGSVKAGAKATTATAETARPAAARSARQSSTSRCDDWQLPCDGWLSPIASSDVPHDADRVLGCGQGRRASDHGFLPMRLDDYLQLLDWTGRQLRRGKRAAIPGPLRGILDRLHIDAASWTDCVRHFGRWFPRAAGRSELLLGFAERAGQSWLHGLKAARLAFG